MAEKDAGLRIRVERDLREKFQKTCRAHGEPAAQVLRQFMREYVGRKTSVRTLLEPSKEQLPQNSRIAKKRNK